MALTLPFLSVSCQPQVESAKIVTIDKVGAIAMPEEIAPIGKIPFQMPDLKRPVFPELTIRVIGSSALAPLSDMLTVNSGKTGLLRSGI